MVHFIAYGTVILYYGDYRLVIGQIWFEVSAVKINIFRDSMQLIELQCLDPAFKGWSFFKVILFQGDTFNGCS